MAFVKNPLRDQPEPNSPTAVVAGFDPGAPVSPISGKPMSVRYCHSIPVYVDMENRVVIPVARQE